MKYKYSLAMDITRSGNPVALKPGDTFYEMEIGLNKDREVIGYAILKLTMPEATPYEE